MKFRKKMLLKSLAITSGIAGVVALPIISTACSTTNNNTGNNTQDTKPSIKKILEYLDHSNN